MSYSSINQKIAEAYRKIREAEDEKIAANMGTNQNTTTAADSSNDEHKGENDTPNTDAHAKAAAIRQKAHADAYARNMETMLKEDGFRKFGVPREKYDAAYTATTNSPAAHLAFDIKNAGVQPSKEDEKIALSGMMHNMREWARKNGIQLDKHADDVYRRVLVNQPDSVIPKID